MTGFRSTSSIAAFWEHCKSLDEWKNHPALKDHASLGRSIADFDFLVIFFCLGTWLVACIKNFFWFYLIGLIP